MLKKTWRKWNPLAHCWWECKLIQPLWGAVQRRLKKSKNKTIIWSSNSTTGHTPWETHNSKRNMYPNLYCSTIYNSQDTGATYISINGWIDKEIVVHIYHGILLSHKKERIWVSHNEVDEPRDCYTEWCKSQKTKYSILKHIHEI